MALMITGSLCFRKSTVWQEYACVHRGTLWKKHGFFLNIRFSHFCSLIRSRALLQSSRVSAWPGSRQRAASQSRTVEAKSFIES